MSLILNIDTALDTASVCLTEDDNVLLLSSSENQKDHASWLHTEIAELLQKNGRNIKDLSAVAVSVGPGSYTGLRVGLAAAKGFCYALHIPLITINSLTIIAFAVKEDSNYETKKNAQAGICRCKGKYLRSPGTFHGRDERYRGCRSRRCGTDSPAG